MARLVGRRERRANGEGTVYLRSDGRWVGSAYVPIRGGRRVRRSVYGRTREDAHRKIVERFILPRIGRKRLDRLTPQDVRLLINVCKEERRADGELVSVRTVQMVHAVLRSQSCTDSNVTGCGRCTSWR